MRAIRRPHCLQLEVSFCAVTERVTIEMRVISLSLGNFLGWLRVV